jgi:hypothetical protein
MTTPLNTYPLFKHLQDAYGLTCVEDELLEIIHKCGAGSLRLERDQWREIAILAARSGGHAECCALLESGSDCNCGRSAARARYEEMEKKL